MTESNSHPPADSPSPVSVDETPPPEEPPKKGPGKAIFLIAVVLMVVILSQVFDLGGEWKRLETWIATLGVWAPLAFIAVYIAATVAAIPGSALTLVAGAVFGSVWGLVIISIASTLGASAAFLVGRYFARDSVQGWLADNPKFRELDQLTEEEGHVIVAITRLIPLFPFNLLNYGFGLTKVPFWTYVFWSWLCMLPGTILYVVGADAAKTAIAEERVPWILIGVMAVVFVILFVIGRRARRYFADKKKDREEKKDQVSQEGQEGVAQ